MSAARARRLLLAGFTISLIVHLFLAGYIHWPFLLKPSDESATVKVRVLTIARKTPPPPPPTLPPTPQPTPAVHASMAPPKLATHATSGPSAVRKAIPSLAPAATKPPAPPTSLPTPVAIATSSSSCIHSNSDPSVSATPDPPDIPAEVRAQKISGTTAVQVSLDPQGHVLNTTIAQSSGSTGLDAVASEMARSATYTPKYISCKAVAGTYTYTVKFAAW